MLPALLLLLTAPQSPSVRVPLGEVHRSLPLDGKNTTAVAGGDFDGDGVVDLILAADGPDAFRLGEGTGAFVAAPFPSLDRDTQAVAAADFDGDGALDAFFANDGEDELLLGDGVGGFTVATSLLPVATADSRTATVGDVDLDGDLDLLVGRGGDRVVQLENLGGAVFRDAMERMPAVVARVRAGTLGDMDADGLPDYAAATGDFQAQEQNLYFRNAGSGLFLDQSQVLGGAVDESRSVFARDFDGDGNLDLWIGVFRTAGISDPDLLLLGDGAGRFTSAASFVPNAFRASAKLAEDVDLDGDVDIAMSNGSLYLNDGAGDLTTPAPGTLGGSGSLFDLDLDGDLDAVVDVCTVDDIALNDGAGGFFQIPGGFDETFPVPHWQGDVTRTDCGDVDGDGDLDLVVAIQVDFLGNSLLLFTNDGTGAFALASGQLPSVFNDGFAVELFDVEGDGDLDLVHGNAHGNDFFQNDGDGRFVPVSGVLPRNGFVYDFDAADFDGDGDLDLFGSQGIGVRLENLFYENQGGVLVDDSQRILTNPREASLESAVLDFDLDGDLDVLVGNGTLGIPDQLLINEGGTFTDGAGLLPTPNDHATTSLDVGDIDNDGDPDVVLGTSVQSGAEVVWRNEGGRFVDVSAGLPSTENCFAIRLGDVDGDGNLDVFVGGFLGPPGAGNDRLWLGDGSGSFSASGWVATTGGTLTSTADAILEDFDGDGDLDLFLADVYDPRLFQGLRRHVARTAPPSIGKRLDIDLFGTPLEPWRLLIGTRAVRRVSDFGLLLVDPELLLDVPAHGVLDGAGEARFTLPIPPDPGLVGLDLRLQALEGAPPRLTNVDASPIRDL